MGGGGGGGGGGGWITFPFPNFNGCTVEVWEWISNFEPHFTWHMIDYPLRDSSKFMSLKGAPSAMALIAAPYLNE